MIIFAYYPFLVLNLLRRVTTPCCLLPENIKLELKQELFRQHSVDDDAIFSRFFNRNTTARSIKKYFD